MGLDTNRKRLHSALNEPPIAQERKRTKHEPKSAQPAVIHRTNASSNKKHSLDSHPQNTPRSSIQAETPETPSRYALPEPYGSQGSHLYIENFMKQGFAPNGSSSPATIASRGNHLSLNKLGCSKQKVAIIQSSQDSFDEKCIFTANSEHSSLNSSLPTDDVISPSSPKTVSDYRSFGSETESEYKSKDDSISTRSTSSPNAFNRSTHSMLDSSSAIESRIRSFLPIIQEANEILERARAEGRLASRNIENVDENDEQYIEMNLGLGVLEEKKERDISWKTDGSERESESESESESDEESGIDSDEESGSDSESESENDGESEDESESDLASKTESDFVSETDPEFASESESKSAKSKPKPQPQVSTHKETNHLARMMGQPRQLAKNPVIEEIFPID